MLCQKRQLQINTQQLARPIMYLILLIDHYLSQSCTCKPVTATQQQLDTGNGWLGFKVGGIRRLGGKGGGGGGGMRKRSPTSLKIIKDLQSETTAVSDHVQSACYCVNGPAPRHNQPPL